MRPVLRFAALIAFVAGPLAAQDSVARPATSPARELLRSLNSVRVDAAQAYNIRDLNLRRGVVRLSFAEGKFAFLTTTNGRLTGAVFTGTGRAVAAPRDPVEKRSLARFLGAPLLDQPFSRAYLRFTDDTGEELRRLLGTAGVAPAPDPSFAEEWESTVTNLNPGHSLRILADWLSTNPRPYFYAGLQGDIAGPFDILLDHRREEQVLLGQPRWVGSARYYDIWASLSESGVAESGGGLPDSSAFAPLSYALETTIQPDLTLLGRTRLRLRALRGGDRLVPLELSRFLAVESVTGPGGQGLDFFQNEAIHRQEIAQRGNDGLYVVLSKPAQAGEEFTLEISCRGSVISDAGNGVFFVGERGSWYPHAAGGDRFAPFELSFRWPRRLRLVATGKKLDEREEGEWRIGRWQAEFPLPVAGFNLGEYETQHFEVGKASLDLYANAQLEAAIANLFARPSSPTAAARSSDRTRPGSPPSIARLALPDPPPPSPAALLKKLGTELADAVRYYEKLNGPFPFERLAVAQIPGSFGQGWPGLLYLSTLSFLTPEAQTRAGIGRRTQEQFTDLIPFHEVAHQWWGGIVGWSSYRDQWIEEGLSNYLALMYLDQKKPGGRELAGWLDTFRHELTAREPGGDESVESAGPLTLGHRLRSSKSPSAYTQIVYGKGAWVFHMLRMMLRDNSPAAKNPDARFIDVLRGLLEQQRFKSLSNADLARAFEKNMTPAMDLDGDHTLEWFFDQWVRGTGIPSYKVVFKVRPATAGTAPPASAAGAAPSAAAWTINGMLRQSGVPSSFAASVPLYAARPGGKPVFLGNVVTTGEETPFQFTARFLPRKLLIDPNATLLTLPD